MSKHLKPVALVLCSAILISSYQNCGTFKPNAQPSETSSSSPQPNGNTGGNVGSGPRGFVPNPSRETYKGPTIFSSNSEAYKTLCTAVTGITGLARCPIPPILFGDEGFTYNDPLFGSKITLLKKGFQHHYSFQSAFNMNGDHVILHNNTGYRIAVVNIQTREVVWAPTVVGENLGTGDARWSGIENEVFYYSLPNKILKLNFKFKTIETYIDLTAAPYTVSDAETGANHDLAADDWTAFFSLGAKKLCLIHLPTKNGKCASYDPSPLTATTPLEAGRIDLILAKNFDSESKRLYVLLSAQPAFGVWSADRNFASLDFEFRAPEILREMQSATKPNDFDGVCEAGEECAFANVHMDMFQDSTGRQFLAPVQIGWSCKITMAYFQINKKQNLLLDAKTGGGRHRFDFIYNQCGGNVPWSYADHIGCAKNAPTCVVSIEYWDKESPDAATKANFYSELIAITDLGRDFKRLGQYRSFYDGYWDSPRPAISNDGQKVLFDSNLGKAGDLNSLLLETNIKYDF